MAVLICKAMIEIPARFAGKAPVNPAVRADKNLFKRQWLDAHGLAEDVRFYGKWMRDEAEKRMGHLYPKIEITAEMAKGRSDLTPLVGKTLTVIAWLWARTTKSPNPAFANIDVPLASTFMLSTKAGNEVYVEPVVEGDGYRFLVKMGKPRNPEAAKNGTKLAGANFECVMSGTPISGEYIKSEGKAGRMNARLMAIVAEGERKRVYLQATEEMEKIASMARPEWRPEGDVPARLTGGTCVPYGFTTWGDLFTPRQLVALTTFSDLVLEARERVMHDAIAAGLADEAHGLEAGGTGATAYADAVAVYLAMATSRVADYGSAMSTWRPKDNAMRSTLAKQALPMVWDYAEGSPLAESSSGFFKCVEVIAGVIATCLGDGPAGHAEQADAARPRDVARSLVFSTDPPYYSNIGYADLSDFFYVWLRRSLNPVLPGLFATVAAPKAEELVATSYRHGGTERAEEFFLNGMTHAMHCLRERAHPAFPVTIYYAFKQSESETEAGTASTGWETFLDAVIRAGLAISGTWPMRTEGDNRQVGIGANALASSIVLVCRSRATDAPTATRREFITALKAELPSGVAHLRHGNIAPVDLAQAAIGPGMAIYTRYSKVLDAEGKPLTVREALALINHTLDEALAEQEGAFDSDTRWAVVWFDEFGFDEGEFGRADDLARAKVTAVDGLVRAGIVRSGRSKVRLLKPNELPKDWDPMTDPRLNAWEIVHHLIRVLETAGEGGAAELLAKLGSKAETARELAYRLYTICERKKRAADALAYNGLVQSWPEITRLARESGKPRAAQAELLLESEE